MADPAYSAVNYDRIVRLDPAAAPAIRYAMLNWIDTFPDGVWKVGPPVADEDLDVFTSAGIPMQPGDESPATDDRSRVAAYAPEDGIPQVGEEWGTKAGDYRLRKGYRGFRITCQGFPDGCVNVVRQFAIKPRKSSGSGSGVPPDQLGGSVDLRMIQSLSSSACSITYAGQVVRIQIINNQLVGSVIGSFGGTLTLGPFVFTGSVSVGYPGATGTISGTVGTCSYSGTVDVPAIPPTTVPVTGTVTCGP